MRTGPRSEDLHQQFRLISLTGVDGSGKTTALKSIEPVLRSRSISVLYVPQYNFPAGSRDLTLAQDIERLGQLADRRSDPTLKAVALFTAMLLFADAARSLETEEVLCERHPSLDCLVYSKFYGRFLTGPLNRERDQAESIAEEIGSDSLAGIEAYALRASGGITLWDYPLWLKAILELDHFQQIAKYRELFRVELPEHVISIELTPELLAQRLAKKFSSPQQSHAKAEQHEQLPLLMQLQTLYGMILKELSTQGVLTFEIVRCASDNDGARVIDALKRVF